MGHSFEADRYFPDLRYDDDKDSFFVMLYIFETTPYHAKKPAVVYYTTDGSIPTNKSLSFKVPGGKLGNRWDGVINLYAKEYGSSVTIKAITVVDNKYCSEVGSYTYKFPKHKAPDFLIDTSRGAVHEYQPGLLRFVNPYYFELPEGCTMYYTTDGSTLTRDSKRYYGAFYFDHVEEKLHDIVIKAIYVGGGLEDGDDITEARYAQYCPYYKQI